MSPAAAAKAAGISRQGLMKSICEGNFLAGGIEFQATRKGKNWDVAIVRQTDTQAIGGHDRRSRKGELTPASQGGQTLTSLKLQSMVTKIQLDQQKLAEHDRALRKRFAECVNTAVKAAGSDFAGKARALRLAPEQAEAVGKLGQSLKDEIHKRFIEELKDWSASIEK